MYCAVAVVYRTRKRTLSITIPTRNTEIGSFCFLLFKINININIKGRLPYFSGRFVPVDRSDLFIAFIKILCGAGYSPFFFCSRPDPNADTWKSQLINGNGFGFFFLVSVLLFAPSLRKFPIKDNFLPTKRPENNRLIGISDTFYAYDERNNNNKKKSIQFMARHRIALIIRSNNCVPSLARNTYAQQLNTCSIVCTAADGSRCVPILGKLSMMAHPSIHPYVVRSTWIWIL